jgi:threonine/homoserine efflux transporter RhtA
VLGTHGLGGQTDLPIPFEYAAIGRDNGVVLLPGTGHLLTNYALAHIPLIVPAVLNLFVPAGSTLLAWLLVDERLLAVQVAGVVVVVSALAVMIATTNPGTTAKPAVDS